VRLLLIGGSGQLGNSLQAISWDSSVEIFAPVSSALNVTNSVLVFETIKKFDPDFVINASAWTNVPGAEDNFDLALKVNSEAVGNLALACKEYNSALIHVSTDYVFDGEKGTPYLESDVCNPVNSYGMSKMYGEHRIIESGLNDYYIIRTSWLYSQYGKNFVKTIINRALKGEKSSITNDQFGSPTFAGDLARAISSLVLNPPTPGIYNFSNSGITTWHEFGRVIYKHVGADDNLVEPRETEINELRRPKYSPLDLEKWIGTNLYAVQSWKHSLRRELDSIVTSVREEDK
jgi:dTDP-4-dehydrorhamnose reductase